MHPAVTYTLLALAAALVGAGWWLNDDKRAKRFPRLRKLSVTFMFAGALGAYLTLRPGTGDDQTVVAKAIAAKQPIFIDVYSNY